MWATTHLTSTDEWLELQVTPIATVNGYWIIFGEATVSGGQWISIGKTGYVVQPQLQATGFLNQRPDVEYVQLDATFEDGGVVV
ncbi:hypothetical protein EN746_23880 [Mesorhizobium sp. M8A.F.Ca.ET.023.02.2.1]|nr:hypothetical protein EN746_23880 [Mesorhizobium sp. M8A.F.Ca.ET.023.02.2.1]